MFGFLRRRQPIDQIIALEAAIADAQSANDHGHVDRLCGLLEDERRRSVCNARYAREIRCGVRHKPRGR